MRYLKLFEEFDFWEDEEEQEKKTKKRAIIDPFSDESFEDGGGEITDTPKKLTIDDSVIDQFDDDWSKEKRIDYNIYRIKFNGVELKLDRLETVGYKLFINQDGKRVKAKIPIQKVKQLLSGKFIFDSVAGKYVSELYFPIQNSITKATRDAIMDLIEEHYTNLQKQAKKFKLVVPRKGEQLTPEELKANRQLMKYNYPLDIKSLRSQLIKQCKEL